MKIIGIKHEGLGQKGSDNRRKISFSEHTIGTLWVP